MTRRYFLISLIILFLCFAAARRPAAAQGPPPAQGQPLAPTVVSDEAVVSFPETVTFRLQLESQQEVAAATLNYRVQRRRCVPVDTEAPAEVDGDVVEWTWIMSRSGNPPPGAELWWQWSLEDEQGNVTHTEPQTMTLEDPRFEWQTVSQEHIHLHWYEGQDVGPTLLDAAVGGLQRLEQEMGIELQDDVSFYIYGDAADMRQAVLYVQDWAGGVAFTDYNTILIGVAPEAADEWGRETVRHELAHLVVGQFGWSCLGGERPTWLEEGLATYAEGPADEGTRQDIEQAITENSFAPLRTLGGSFPSHDRQAGLAYSQSYSVVAFLLEQYGQDKLQELILTLAQGVDDDAALEAVYGFNVDGLEMAWREAIGAPPRQIPPTPTAIRAAAVPTVAPLGGPQDVPTPPSAAAPAPAVPTPRGTCALGLAPLLLLGLAVLAPGARRRRERRG